MTKIEITGQIFHKSKANHMLIKILIDKNFLQKINVNLYLLNFEKKENRKDCRSIMVSSLILTKICQDKNFFS